jgi:DNA-binding NtrC family response regulator
MKNIIQKILIVGDNATAIKSMQKTVENFYPSDNRLEILMATSEQGTKILLHENKDIKLILLDEKMENDDAGKQVFDFVRRQLKNNAIQFIFFDRNGLDSESLKTSIASGLEAYDKEALIIAETEVSKTPARKEIETIMGSGKVISKVFDQVEKYAKKDIPILIAGETGTGKELIVNYLLKNSSREKIKIVNCASLSPELADSELFGHSKGAYTGADNETIGILRAIDGGILFWDEINSLPIKVQIKLLRVIEYGTFERVGDMKEFKVNVRIIAATNEPLQNLIEEGKFRKDLYERFTKKIYVPTLNERIEDMNYFIDFFLSLEKDKQVFISDKARKVLSEYKWTGNVRQLKNTIINLVIEVELDKKSKKYIIQPELVIECLHEHDGRREDNVLDNSNLNFQIVVDTAKRNVILLALKKTGGNNKEAMLLLGMSPRTYYREKERLGIK